MAQILRDNLGEGRVFFDEWYESELAGPDADIVLTRIYTCQTCVVVVCIGDSYAESPWAQEEWRAIRGFERGLRDASSKNIDRMRILLLRFADGEIHGVDKNAYVPDVRARPIAEIADLIQERLANSKRLLSPTGPTGPISEHSASVFQSLGGFETGLESELTLLLEQKRQLVIDGADEGQLAEIDSCLTSIRRRRFNGYPLRAGLRLANRFELLSQIGEGGIAVVWKAYDTKRLELVSVKILHGHLRHDLTQQKRFSAGAETMMKLSHQNIVRVVERCQQDFGHWFFVMQYVGGSNLGDTLRNEPLPREKIIAMVATTCRALAHAHQHHVIHRDISPSNILVDKRTHEPFLKDFDLARIPNATVGSAAQLGTIGFVAPEILHENRFGDTRSDIYSLAMTLLYALASGKLGSLGYRSPLQFIPSMGCNIALRAVLTKALAENPDERIQSAAEFAQQLNETLTGTSYVLAVGNDDKISSTQSEFLANTLHELKTPLASFTAYAETLLDGAEVRHQFVERMRQQAERMQDFLGDLHSLVRLEESAIAVLIEDVTVAAVVSEVIDSVETKSTNRQIQIMCNGAAEDVIRTDREMLRAIVSNLVDNAIIFSKPGKRIEVGWAISEGKVEIRVEDEGMGIPEQFLDRVFDRYFRIDRAKAREEMRSGLGCRLSNSCVRRWAETFGCRAF